MTPYYDGETNPPTAAQKAATKTVDWTEPGLYITRFHIMADPDFEAWDVSYCYGTLDGEAVRVKLPFSQLPERCSYIHGPTGEKRKGGWKAALIAECAKYGLNAKRLGILDNASMLI